MNLDKIQSIYFIGIGGIGMSGLARYFNIKGKKIYGYDRTTTPLTDELKQEGMEIHFEEDTQAIPQEVDLVVYTPAIPSDHKELVYYQNRHVPIVKRSKLLEAITKHAFTIAIAGTHGKTTTTSMVAHLLKSSGYDCTAFLGGIAANYNSNFLAGKNNTVVVEADEYDRSFLKLHPDIAVVTSCDPDHLDIYGSEEEVVKAYGEFANQIKGEGTLITKKKLPFLAYYSHLNTRFYSISDETDYRASNVSLQNGTYHFDLVTPTDTVKNIHLNVAGYHNVENAVAAGAVGHYLEIASDKIREGLSSFNGVRRRFEYIVRNDNVIYIDDYAHHPAEITAFLKSVREIFPARRVLCIFQPHLYTRTRDFADAFGKSLSLADALILLPIYPARETPIEDVTSEMLLNKISLSDKKIVEKEDVLNELAGRKEEIIVTVGAGDIDQLVEPIKKFLNS